MKNRNYLKTIKGFYSENVLTQGIAVSAAILSDAEFGRYQIKLVSEYAGLEIQRISVGVRTRAGAGRQESQAEFQGNEAKNQNWQLECLPERGFDPGRAQNTLFKEEYCIPNMQGRRFIVEYFAKDPRPNDQLCLEDALQYLSVPFYFAWLMRWGHIDVATLEDWYRLLVGVTPARLNLLREIVCVGRYQTGVIANRLALSDRVVRNYIAEALHAVSHLLPDLEMASANSSQCIDLVRYYWFLRYVGTIKKR